MRRLSLPHWLPRFDTSQGGAASVGVIVDTGMSMALAALWQPSYKVLPILSLFVLISTAWRIRAFWPDMLTAIRPFELGGALGLMFIADMASLYGLIPLLILICIVPRSGTHKSRRT